MSIGLKEYDVHRGQRAWLLLDYEIDDELEHNSVLTEINDEADKAHMDVWCVQDILSRYLKNIGDDLKLVTNSQ